MSPYAWLLIYLVCPALAGRHAATCGLRPSASGHPQVMIGLIVTLLIIWAVLAVLGLAVKGLFWLFVIGLILFVATGIVGWVRRRT